MNIVEWVGEDDFQPYPFSFKKCETSDFYNLVDNAFETNDLKGYLCPNFSNNSTFTSGSNFGLFVVSIFFYLLTRVYKIDLLKLGKQ